MVIFTGAAAATAWMLRARRNGLAAAARAQASECRLMGAGRAAACVLQLARIMLESVAAMAAGCPVVGQVDRHNGSAIVPCLHALHAILQHAGHAVAQLSRLQNGLIKTAKVAPTSPLIDVGAT